MNRLTYTDPNTYHGTKIWESMRSQHDQRSIGALKLKTAKHDLYLYDLDDFDQGYFADRVTLRKNEKLLRYETAITKIGGMMPLIKVNMRTGLVYFLRDLYADDYQFDTISEKPVWIDIHADFNIF